MHKQSPKLDHTRMECLSKQKIPELFDLQISVQYVLKIEQEVISLLITEYNMPAMINSEHGSV